MRKITLEEYVRRKLKGKGLDKALSETYSEWVKGKIKLIDPNPPRDYVSYLSNPAYSQWLWLMVSTVFLTLVSISLSNIVLFKYLRYVLGTIFVLYLPGASLIETLYPVEEELSPLERLALSIGLSLALVPLVGLALNFTPWGIRLTPVLTSLTFLTLALTFLASWRKYLEVKKSIARTSQR